MESKKFLLQEKDIPTAWYNIVADMENKPASSAQTPKQRNRSSLKISILYLPKDW